MSECVSCEYFDITQNKCYIDNRVCYDRGRLLVNDCERYEEGHWSVPDLMAEKAEQTNSSETNDLDYTCGLSD